MPSAARSVAWYRCPLVPACRRLVRIDSGGTTASASGAESPVAAPAIVATGATLPVASGANTEIESAELVGHVDAPLGVDVDAMGEVEGRVATRDQADRRRVAGGGRCEAGDRLAVEVGHEQVAVLVLSDPDGRVEVGGGAGHGRDGGHVPVRAGRVLGQRVVAGVGHPQVAGGRDGGRGGPGEARVGP